MITPYGVVSLPFIFLVGHGCDVAPADFMCFLFRFVFLEPYTDVVAFIYKAGRTPVRGVISGFLINVIQSHKLLPIE